MAELLITTASGRTRTHQLGEATIVLGRDPACDIPLEDLGASRRHASIRFENGVYVITDLGSKNGTLVNDVAVPSQPLHHGDEILIGGAQVVYRDVAPTADQASVVIADETPRQQPTTYSGSVDEGALSHRRLQILYDLADRLTRLRERDDLLNDAMDVCFEMLRFERGAIAVRQTRGNLVDWPVVRNLRGREGELTVSRTILASALTHGERVILNDTADGPIDPTISIVRNNIRSAMCVPLLSEGRNLGVIYGDRVSSGTTYSKEDVDFLAAIARLITTGLVNAQLLKEQKLKLQLEAEMGMARQIQKGLFPATLPDRPNVRVAALNDPGYHVSGDYYDVIPLAGGRIGLLVADVTGEGVAASLLMANLQAAVRLTLPSERPLADLLDQWNGLISVNTDASKFITCLIGILDPAARTLELGLAGHHPPHRVSAAGCMTLEMEPGYPLGVIEDARYATQVFPIGPLPCTIVGYTDGVVEAMNETAELYSTDRLVELLASAEDRSPTAMIERIRSDVRRHSGTQAQSDDITILVVEIQ